MFKRNRKIRMLYLEIYLIIWNLDIIVYLLSLTMYLRTKFYQNRFGVSGLKFDCKFWRKQIAPGNYLCKIILMVPKIHCNWHWTCKQNLRRSWLDASGFETYSKIWRRHTLGNCPESNCHGKKNLNMHMNR